MSNEHKDKLIIAFNLQKLAKNKIDETVNDIFGKLKEIAGVYIYYHDSYNAYKHGHRVWYGYNQTTSKSYVLWYITRENKPNSYEVDYVPLDDSVSTDHIMPRSKDCQSLCELILHNNKP